MKRLGRLIVPFLGLAILVAACDLDRNLPAIDSTPSPAATSPALDSEPIATPQDLVQPTEEPAVSALRIWIPPEIGTRTQAGAQEFVSQVRAYQTSHPELEIIIEQKPIGGQGGVLSYLQTGRDIAPGIMPDIVAVPIDILGSHESGQYFFPLDESPNTDLMADFYPTVREGIVADGQLLGLPFATTGLTSLVHRPGVVTQTLPLTWTNVISETGKTLVFPADSREGAMLGLQLYLAEGGALVDETGQQILETEPLARALTTLGVNKDNLLQSRQLKTPDEAWQYHQLGLSDFLWVTSDFLLGQLAVDPSLEERIEHDPVPGVSGQLIPLTNSWAWAVSTADPARQILAKDLIAFLAAPENLANWSSRSQVLPARRSAVAILAEDIPYYQFAAGQMEIAQTMPLNETGRLLDVMGDAVFQVMTTESSPVLIAEQAAMALRQ